MSFEWFNLYRAETPKRGSNYNPASLEKTDSHASVMTELFRLCFPSHANVVQNTSLLNLTFRLLPCFSRFIGTTVHFHFVATYRPAAPPLRPPGASLHCLVTRGSWGIAVIDSRLVSLGGWRHRTRFVSNFQLHHNKVPRD